MRVNKQVKLVWLVPNLRQLNLCLTRGLNLDSWIAIISIVFCLHKQQQQQKQDFSYSSSCESTTTFAYFDSFGIKIRALDVSPGRLANTPSSGLSIFLMAILCRSCIYHCMESREKAPWILINLAGVGWKDGNIQTKRIVFRFPLIVALRRVVARFLLDTKHRATISQFCTKIGANFQILKFDSFSKQPTFVARREKKVCFNSRERKRGE